MFDIEAERGVLWFPMGDGWRAWSMFTLLIGCSSDDDTIKERHDYQDSSGRSCQATLEKTSSGSPSIKQSVECDGEPKACSGESKPCFVLSVDESEMIRNCPACCKGSSSSFVGAECAIVACETDADCVYAEAECQAGLCRCPGGYCE